MAVTQESGQASAPAPNGSDVNKQLSARIRELELECQALHAALAACQSERDEYLKAIIESARAAREFADVDIETLESMSAGPFRKIPGLMVEDWTK